MVFSAIQYLLYVYTWPSARSRYFSQEISNAVVVQMIIDEDGGHFHLIYLIPIIRISYKYVGYSKLIECAKLMQ